MKDLFDRWESEQKVRAETNKLKNVSQRNGKTEVRENGILSQIDENGKTIQLVLRKN